MSATIVTHFCSFIWLLLRSYLFCSFICQFNRYMLNTYSFLDIIVGAMNILSSILTDFGLKTSLLPALLPQFHPLSSGINENYLIGWLAGFGA